jgi:cytidine deaminase
MNQKEWVSKFIEFSSVDELPEDDRKLIDEARKSVRNAYAPYSRFNVGAAVRLDNGQVVLGNNQENASYPIGMCAERVAIFAAAANFPASKISTIAITAQSGQFLIDQPVTPCGACRQAIAEYEHRYQHPIRLVMTGETGTVLVAESIKNFLPYQFNGDDLKAKLI